MIDLTVHDAALDGRAVDIDIAGGRVVAIEPVRPRPGAAPTIDAGGGALLPGLHDHHIHLAALAAARASVAAGPPAVTSGDQLVAVLRAADGALPNGQWIRGVGYHESVAGDIDRHWLDAAVPGRPVRVQHRSGAAWILNTAAVAAVELDTAGEGVEGVERGDGGELTGRVFRRDDWLRRRVPGVPLDVGAAARELASFGVTAVTDATPIERAEDAELLAGAAAHPGFPVRIVLTGAPGLMATAAPALARGPVKLVVADHALPPLDAVTGGMRHARRLGRTVAVHCVTLEGLLLALAAWDEVGAVPGDRVEHGAVIPVDAVARLIGLGLTVVTQPSFVRERGDTYLADVDAADRPDLWRCGSLITAGVPVGGSTDAPFGPADPWLAIAAAVDRRTVDGRVMGPDERIDAATAIGLFLAPLEHPGGPVRRIVVGGPADLCVLDAPLDEVHRDPSSERVAATVAAGQVTYAR